MAREELTTYQVRFESLGVDKTAAEMRFLQKFAEEERVMRFRAFLDEGNVVARSRAVTRQIGRNSTNQFFQIGQAFEDALIGAQLNGIQGLVRGASNNLSFLLAGTGAFGAVATIGLALSSSLIPALTQTEDAGEKAKEELENLKASIDAIGKASSFRTGLEQFEFRTSVQLNEAETREQAEAVKSGLEQRVGSLQIELQNIGIARDTIAKAGNQAGNLFQVEFQKEVRNSVLVDALELLGLDEGAAPRVAANLVAGLDLGTQQGLEAFRNRLTEFQKRFAGFDVFGSTDAVQNALDQVNLLLESIAKNETQARRSAETLRSVRELAEQAGVRVTQLQSANDITSAKNIAKLRDELRLLNGGLDDYQLRVAQLTRDGVGQALAEQQARVELDVKEATEDRQLAKQISDSIRSPARDLAKAYAKIERLEQRGLLEEREVNDALSAAVATYQDQVKALQREPQQRAEVFGLDQLNSSLQSIVLNDQRGRESVDGLAGKIEGAVLSRESKVAAAVINARRQQAVDEQRQHNTLKKIERKLGRPLRAS